MQYFFTVKYNNLITLKMQEFKIISWLIMALVGIPNPPPIIGDQFLCVILCYN